MKLSARHPLRLLQLIARISFKARNISIALKNLVVLPKAIYLSKKLKNLNVVHVHAHWASTPSTIGYVIADIAGIPWSFTAHRWDITENNILREKVRTASFVRVISRSGQNDLMKIIQNESLEKKIIVLHMGVELQEVRPKKKEPAIFTILCPANLISVKGHRYLFEGCQILMKRKREFKCLVAGDGPLEAELKELVSKLGLNEHVAFLGRIPHERLLKLYSEGEIDVVVLPSIVTEDGEKEGIPVSLMEAMAFGVPVVSTDIGGTPELIGDGSGIMVKEKNPETIADALDRLMSDEWLYMTIGQNGRIKIEKEFDVAVISETLQQMFFED